MFAKRVTTGREPWAGKHEFYPSQTNADSFFHTSINNTSEPNKRGVDDDNDGKTDEDELDGIDNDGDGMIDEDYPAISHSDYYCGYTDTFHVPTVAGHFPLGIKVWQ